MFLKKKHFFQFFMINLCLFSIFSIIINMMYSNIFLIEYELFSYKSYSMNLTMLIDKISLVFVLMVSTVSSLVLVYSKHYMMNFSENFNKFIVTLFIFIVSMILLSVSVNLYWIMIAWDGLGVSSFILIIFFQNWKSFNSGFFTFLTNRVGDFFLISSMVWASCFYSLSVSFPFEKKEFFFSFFLVIAAMTKSAQFPFSAWLPQAMAAPTPVSSLVHSSTLVTAGIYLCIRFFEIFSKEMLSVIFFVSIVSVVFAGTSALFENDMKKIVALSTLCHLSLIFIFISMNELNCAVFHLTIHALFKSLLFMVIGVMIHMSVNMQDIRQISIPLNSYNMIWIIMAISTFSMAGVPFMSGFYSKDFMLMSMLNEQNFCSLIFVLFAIIMTWGYSFRMIFHISKNYSLQPLQTGSHIGGMEKIMIIGSIYSTVLGGILSWLIFDNAQTDFVNTHNQFVIFMVYLSIILGCLIGYYCSKNMNLKNFLIFLKNMWYLNYMSTIFHKMILKNSNFIYLNNDSKGFLDWWILSVSKNIMLYNEKMINMSFFLSFKKNVMMLFIYFFIHFFSILWILN
nr:NADH dehydrogenase subunit 5 [Trichophilopterus babakotophilus]